MPAGLQQMRQVARPWKYDYHICMESKISATEAARTLSELLSRVRYRGESFVIERGGEPVCRMIPAGPPRCTVADLVRILQTTAKADPDYLDTVAELARAQPKLPRTPWGR